MKQQLLLILTSVTLTAFMNVSFGQTAPNLGTTSSFALFTATGALGNTGASMVAGDIGTNVGAITGFTPGLVTGNIRAEASAQSTQAAADVIAAYNSLTPATCGAVIAAELGGQTLLPGVSCQNTASPTSLNGTLTLSGSGVFIIKLSSALTTATNSNIVFTNGASASNVYFQVDGAVTLGTGSIFQGTILANGAIFFNTQASLTGRALSKAGAITLNNNKVITPALAALPVSLVSFTAKAQDRHTVNIAWTTSLETNNKGFLVERSKDLKGFEKVGEVSEVALNSNALTNYRLIDQTPYSGTSYYRLTQTDLNGRATVYPAVSVILRDEAYGVYPNPVTNGQRFAVRLDEPESAVINFYNVDGRSLPLQNTGAESGNLTMKTVGKLATGIYIITVEERGQTRKHRLLVE